MGDRVCSCLQSSNKKIFKATSTPWRLSRVSQVSETFLHLKSCVPVEAAPSLGHSGWFSSCSGIMMLHLMWSTSLLSFFFVFLSSFCVYVKEFPCVHGQAWTGSAPGINYIGVHSSLLWNYLVFARYNLFMGGVIVITKGAGR